MPTYLTAAEQARLARMAGEAHKTTRMLTDADLDTITGEVALMKDSEGVAPGGTGYVTTIDIYRAAAEAWRQKAGMVADGFDFEADGGVYNRSQVYEHYLKQAARYANMAGNLTVEVGRYNDDAGTDAFEEWLDGGGG